MSVKDLIPFLRSAVNLLENINTQVCSLEDKIVVDEVVYTASPEYFVLSGIGTWSMPSNVSAISIYVADLGTGSTPTLTTDSGTRPIYLGQKLDWSVRSNNAELFVDPVLTVTTNHADDIITITYILIT